MRSVPFFVTVACLVFVLFITGGCGSGDGSQSDGSGFSTPEAALDAYGQSLEKGDEAAFRKVAAKDQDAIGGLDALISFQTDMTPTEAAKVNLVELAKLQGFSVMNKRFPAEIDGDKAVIVHVVEGSGAFDLKDRFRKWKFEKSGGSWHLVGSEFGEADKLPAKYAWDKGIADVSDVMRDFISGFDGTAKKVEAALDKYAKDVETNMGFFSLEKPIVIGKTQKDGKPCYTLRVQSGSVLRTYNVCWDGEKIASIEELE